MTLHPSIEVFHFRAPSFILLGMASKSDSVPAPGRGRPGQSSGVHARARGADAAGRASEWREAIEVADGEVSPTVDSLLSAYEALELRSRFFSEQLLASRSVLDRLSLSVHVVSRSGVVFVNAAGRALEREGVVVHHEDGLECAAFEAKEHFAAAVAAAQRRLDARRPFVLVRDSGPRLLGLAISAGRSLPGAAIVVIGTPDAGDAIDAEVISQHFGLTPAEARVAVCLAMGETARQAAESLEIGVETVRTHVKSILRKMGTNRQVDAVRMLVTGPLLIG